MQRWIPPHCDTVTSYMEGIEEIFETMSWNSPQDKNSHKSSAEHAHCDRRWPDLPPAATSSLYTKTLLSPCPSAVDSCNLVKRHPLASPPPSSIICTRMTSTSSTWVSFESGGEWRKATPISFYKNIQAEIPEKVRTLIRTCQPQFWAEKNFFLYLGQNLS